jgi:phosphoribosyl-ATP pyrophosphohydrolase
MSERTQDDVLDRLAATIALRRGSDPASSYVAQLLARGDDAILKKIGEEATEVILAAKGETDERLAEEAADLLFHLSVALHERGVPWARVLEVLERRRR